MSRSETNLISRKIALLKKKVGELSLFGSGELNGGDMLVVGSLNEHHGVGALDAEGVLEILEVALANDLAGARHVMGFDRPVRFGLDPVFNAVVGDGPAVNGGKLQHQRLFIFQG